jgi:hydrogenase maturation protease
MPFREKKKIYGKFSNILAKNLSNGTKIRIICIGNRYRPEDSAGPLVYDQLMSGRLSGDIDVIDGGLAGLNLLRFMNGVERVVFIDAVNGFRPSGGVIVIDAEDASRHADTIFGHNAGLSYFLRVLPEVHDGKLPEIFVVGIEGTPDSDKILEAAEVSLKIAVRGESAMDNLFLKTCTV